MLPVNFSCTKLFATSIIVSSIIFTGCASKVAVSDNITQAAAAEAEQATYSPELAIQEAETALTEAKGSDLTYFSPLHLKQATEALKDARIYLQAPPKDIKNAALMSAIAAKKYIEDAHKNKDKVTTVLAESLKQLSVLESISSQSILPEEFVDVKESLSDLIKDIEKGQVTDATNGQVSLMKEMTELEIDTLKKTHLGEAFAFLDKASENDADDYAPITYEKAEKALSGSIAYIEKNYSDREGVKEAGNVALLATKKAYYVALEAQKLLKMTEEKSEQHVLDLYGLFNKIYKEISSTDIPPQKLYSMAELLTQDVATLKAELRAAKATQKAPVFEQASNEAVEQVSNEAAATTPMSTESTITKTPLADPAQDQTTEEPAATAD